MVVAAAFAPSGRPGRRLRRGLRQHRLSFSGHAVVDRDRGRLRVERWGPRGRPLGSRARRLAVAPAGGRAHGRGLPEPSGRPLAGFLRPHVDGATAAVRHRAPHRRPLRPLCRAPASDGHGVAGEHRPPDWGPRRPCSGDGRPGRPGRGLAGRTLAPAAQTPGIAGPGRALRDGSRPGRAGPSIAGSSLPHLGVRPNPSPRQSSKGAQSDFVSPRRAPLFAPPVRRLVGQGLRCRSPPTGRHGPEG